MGADNEHTEVHNMENGEFCLEAHYLAHHTHGVSSPKLGASVVAASDAFAVDALGHCRTKRKTDHSQTEEGRFQMKPKEQDVAQSR